ncbi:hypothetical protein BGX34_011898 [Mortierella sp. NVP85]|nr:hypothetical protein BGX34_011898 [Mortierella sp. NVP85]
MEEVTQSFFLAGETGIIEILCDNVDGQNIVRWAAIEEIFPRVKYIKRGNIAVNSMMDPNQTRSIKHYPGIVLDVVLSTSDGNEPTTVSRTNNSNNATLQQQYLPSDDDKNATLPSNRIMQYVQKDAMEPDVEQLLVASPPSDPQSKALTSSTLDALVQVIRSNNLGGLGEQLILCLQDLKNEVAKNNELASKNNELASKNHELTAHVIELQEEMKQLQIQALDRLALLQNNVRALLNQTYELHEYSIPRVFIVLPDERSSWNPMDFFSNKFRLYFLCECGEHTKVTNSKIPHHIHLAKHEGYDIDRPNEFFRQYGSYVLTILRMLKFGISMPGVAVPALSHLIRVDALDQATAALKLLRNTMETGMNQVINHIVKASADDGGAAVGYSEPMESNEALEGADLRQLETFLKIKDSSRVLGNLYRTVTSEGHVKWVCLDHYRENYHENAAKAFCDALDVLGGSFDENIGRAEVTLPSKLQAEQFYLALEKARSVHELKVAFDWETTQSDFKRLRDALTISNVGVLELHLKHQDIPAKDILNRNQRFDPILDIMRHQSIQSFTVRGPCNLTKRSSILSRNYDFSNLRHLDISLDQLKDDNLGAKCLITKCSNLSSLALGPSDGSAKVFPGDIFGGLILPSTLRYLDLPLFQLKNNISGFKRLVTDASGLSILDLTADHLGSDNGYVLQAFNAIAEHRTYSINFKGWDLRLPPPPTKGSDQSMAARQCLEHLLAFYCETTGAQYLDRNVLKVFRNVMDSLGRSSDEDISRVEVKLQSSVLAQHFYFALEKARSVRELRVEIGWEATQSDFEKLRDTLVATNVCVLELYLLEQDGPTKGLSNRNQLYDPILDIMRRQSIQSFTIRGPRDFSKQSSLLSRNEDFPHLQHLDISLDELKNDIPGVTHLIANASNLSSLTVGTSTWSFDYGYVLKAYNAIAEHRTYPIKFKEWDLCLPPPPPTKESIDSMAARQCMEHVLKYYCAVTGVQYLSEGVRKLFRNAIDSFWRSPEENIGRIEVTLKSSVQAEHIYFALMKARSVHELKVELDWEATQSDFEKLRVFYNQRASRFFQTVKPAISQ